ncbi:MAG: hypothetical protein OXF74_04845 [Rhodobacteraceae bacterium]|nr:hypothetical protein [Paracoccaceae bacterium]
MDKIKQPEDPRGLIFEAYRIDGITVEDCRTIFFDWALGTPDMADLHELVRSLHAHYSREFPDHPMTSVLHEGLTDPQKPRLRRRRRRSGMRDG